jgi:hypothetical protein
MVPGITGTSGASANMLAARADKAAHDDADTQIQAARGTPAQITRLLFKCAHVTAGVSYY